MNPEHKLILSEKSKDIVDTVKLEDIKQFLLKYKLFNRYMWKDIRSVSDVFNLLPSRGPRAFQNIISILQKAKYDREADILQNASTKRSTLSLKIPNFLYKMSSDPLGYCLIINNEKFHNLPERAESKENVKSLQGFFEGIGYKVSIELNKDSNEMDNLLKEFSKVDCNNAHSAVIIIMSHGARCNNQDIIFGKNGVKKDRINNVHENYIVKRDIIESFNNKECKKLQGKPKVFFFDSDRDEAEDGVRIKIFPVERPDSVASKSVMPTLTDILVVHSTMPGAYSISDEKGSYFCQDLISVLEENWKKLDLETMLKLLNERLLERTESPKFGVIMPSEFDNYAFKLLFFK